MEIIIWLLLALVVMLLVLTSVQLFRQRQQHRDMQAQWQQQSRLLCDIGNDLLDGLESQRNETQSALYKLNQDLIGTLTQLTQTQNALLESTQRQVLLGARSQEEHLMQMQSQLHQSIAQLDARMEQLRAALQGGMDSLRQENTRQLDEMRRTVDEKLTESLNKRLNDSFAQVSQRLEQVYKGLGEMQSLAAGVGDLKKVLSGVKTRGIWGEMQLGALLEQMLSSAQYEANVAVVKGSSERVEYAVRLPGRDGSAIYLPIDSKFPQEDYARLVSASETADAHALLEARKSLMTAVRTEARRISSKYIQPPHTTDFAVMFLPIEGLYAEVTRDMGAVERIQQELRVIIAGPGTLTALLNALQMGFRTLAIEQRSSEVWQLLGAVRHDFSRFADLLDRTRLRIQQASESIDTACSRTRSIQRRLGAVALPDSSPIEPLPDPDEPPA